MSLFADRDLILPIRSAPPPAAPIAEKLARRVRFRPDAQFAGDFRLRVDGHGTVHSTYLQEGEKRVNVDFGEGGFAFGVRVSELELVSE